MALTSNLTAALLAIFVAATASSQEPAPRQAAGGAAEFLVFLGGKQVGREQVNVAQSGGNWIITSSGRITAPTELTINRFEAKYSSDWQPLELHLDLIAGGQPFALNTSFGVTTAVNEITQGGTTNSKTDQVSARTIVLPNNIFAAYEAVAARLHGAAAGTELPVYVVPQTEIKAVVTSVENDQLKSPAGTMEIRTFELQAQNPSGPLAITVTIDAASRLVRVEIPAAGLSVVRADVASVSVRPVVTRNPTDTDVRIPASGFSIAATVTTPPQVAGRLRHPVVILTAGSGPVDRDANVFGIPIFTQLAGALAERGFVVVRYDKRGVGQSGGRIERVTVQDYAEDLRAVVKWARGRRDVDRRRVALVGHSEGGAVAMITAAKTDDVAALVLMAAPGTRGFDLILEQQRLGLEELGASEEERKEKIDLQHRIQTAVLTGVGWEGLPSDLRSRADHPWFRSFLQFDPATVMSDVKQPVLIIQGELDKQVPPHHAEKLAALARARKREADVEVVQLPGVNHLLVRATTGSAAEYNTLKEKTIVPQIPEKIADWLTRVNR